MSSNGHLFSVDLTPREWSDYLSPRLGGRVQVRYGRARTAPVQAERSPRGRWTIRLHEMFRWAPGDVQESLAAWLRAGRRARRAAALLDEWIDARLAELPPRAARRVVLRAAGSRHDLSPLAEELFAREFSADFGEPEMRPGITWGRGGTKRTRRSITFGSYTPTQGVVRIHPVLDQDAVPEWFVCFVLFHEILHAAVPPQKSKDGRTLHHGGEFRRRERAYPEYERAKTWEHAHLAALFASARTGAPLR